MSQMSVSPSATNPADPHVSAFEADSAEPAHKWLLVVVFCLFAGLIPETLFTSSTSPLRMVLNPISLPFISLFYGTAGLVIREVMLRRRAGLAGVLLLGAAFGLVNEGVAAGTWYFVRPEGYMFLGGIDWAWAVLLTVFHTIVSVITPIAFIDIAFPSIRGRSLVGRRGIAICLVLFFACTALTLTPSTALVARLLPYRLTVLAVAVIMSLVAVAVPPRRAATPVARPLPSLWRLRLAGFMATFAFLFLSYAFPVLVARALGSSLGGMAFAQALDGGAMLAFAAFVVTLGWSWSQRAGWSPRENLALLIGAVTFTALVLNLLQAALGEPFATLPFFGLLVALTVRWRRRSSALMPILPIHSA